jgi:glutamine amidotransferase
MCELFGMSARLPATVNLSLEAFSHHGSRRGLNKDGWGLALYQGRDLRLVKEPAPAEGSDCVRFIEGHAMPSPLVIAHIRHATAGSISYANTHPFERELGGRKHAFAHNGKVDALDARDDPWLGAARFQPVGETDSERLFCELLARLEPLWLAAESPSLAARTEVVAAFAEEARGRGVVNFLYADGEALFVHRHYRPQPDGAATVEPGLHVLTRTCPRCDAGFDRPGIAIRPCSGETVEQVATLVATVPLSDEPWRALAVGELVVFVGGELVATRRADPGPVK